MPAVDAAPALVDLFFCRGEIERESGTRTSADIATGRYHRRIPTHAVYDSAEGAVLARPRTGSCSGSFRRAPRGFAHRKARRAIDPASGLPPKIRARQAIVTSVDVALESGDDHCTIFVESGLGWVERQSNEEEAEGGGSEAGEDDPLARVEVLEGERERMEAAPPGLAGSAIVERDKDVAADEPRAGEQGEKHKLKRRKIRKHLESFASSRLLPTSRAT